MERLKQVNISDVTFGKGFWGRWEDVMERNAVMHQFHAIQGQADELKTDDVLGNFINLMQNIKVDYTSLYFHDSDVYKVIEFAACVVERTHNAEIEAEIDRLVDIIAAVQMEDGYLNTYFQTSTEERWTNLFDKHEMYCAGHLLEAAIAYYKASGKRKLLDVAIKFVDHIDSMFGWEEGKKPGCCGHPEIELALVRLYELTGEEKYLKLSKYFIDVRGVVDYHKEQWMKRDGIEESDRSFFCDYAVTNLPARQQRKAVGHAVRAGYLYSGMADIAALTDDTELDEACHALWDNITLKQMLINGGIGVSYEGEKFGGDYNLPNDCYAETCAGISLAFFSFRMFRNEQLGKYMDIFEKVLYNNALSGIALDGKKYYYVNPLTVVPGQFKDRGEHGQLRRSWYVCACCPPNIGRVIASIGSYAYTYLKDSVYVSLFLDSEVTVPLEEGAVHIAQRTDFPWGESSTITIKPDTNKPFTLAVRVPGWCEGFDLTINGQPCDYTVKDGYAYITREWKQGEQVQVSLPMEIRRVHAHPRVTEDYGRVAIQRGPVLYCAEQADNGEDLFYLGIAPDAQITAQYEHDLLEGVVTLTTTGFRTDIAAWGEELYADKEYAKTAQPVKLIPYYSWANRGMGEMRVWLLER